MRQIHRFCAVIPLFLGLTLLLAGCGGGTAQHRIPTDSTVVSGPTHEDTTLSQAPQSSTLKVAILLPLTGQHAALGQSMLNAAQLAVFDIGKDDLELISKDTGGTPAGATGAAKSAMEEGAQLILGPLFAEEVRAVKAITTGHNINVLTFSTDWSLAGGSIYVMGFTPFSQVERIAEYAATRGVRNAAIAAPNDTYGVSVAEAFRTATTKHGIATSGVLSNPSSYDAAFIPANGQALKTSLIQVANTSALKLGTGLWDDTRIAADPAMNGAIFAAPPPSSRRGFEQRYHSTYGTAPVRIASLAYDATALAAALSNTGYTDAALKNPAGFAGVDGIMRFQSNGLMERGVAVLQIKDGSIIELEPAPRTFR
jgi:branched-chain amino acid transport system substrate-binding protein